MPKRRSAKSQFKKLSTEEVRLLHLWHDQDGKRPAEIARAEGPANAHTLLSLLGGGVQGAGQGETYCFTPAAQGPHRGHTWATQGPHMGHTWATHGPHMGHSQIAVKT